MIALLAGIGLAATVTVGPDGVQAAIDRAAPGDVVEVPDGVWPGPVRVDRAVTLRGAGGVIDGGGQGRVITVAAPGAVLEDLQVRASGTDLQRPDACVYVEPEAVGAVIERLDAEECLFGIWIHTTPGVRVEDSTIRGLAGRPNSEKGNGIHLFDASGLIIRGNTVRDARDGIFVSATEDSLIEGNTAEHMRYGIHYMYSYDNTVRGNVTRFNSGGIALMQSRGLVVEDNVSTDNARHGILFRDVMESRIAGNRVERNGEGLFFFSSLDNEIVDNRVAANDIGARVWAGTERNRVSGNAFIGNRQQVYYVAASDQTWGAAGEGNYWSDYLGWDQDGDGEGDRPYRVDSLVARLIFENPAAVLLLHSPTLELLSRAAATVPALRVPTVVDVAPRMRPPVGAP